MVEKIVSGGQTGADRAALDVALRRGLPHGGWCPLGRRAEDGRIPDRYQLAETPLRKYVQRTEWNVRDSNATVVFTLRAKPTGGSRQTVEFATRLKKPCLVLLRPAGTSAQAAAALQRFVAENRIGILNVAGARESTEPGIYDWVTEVLDIALSATADLS